MPHLTINVEGVRPSTHIADGYQPAADWLLQELGRDSSSPYPPVENESALAQLVEAINDKLGASGVEVRWERAD